MLQYETCCRGQSVMFVSQPSTIQTSLLLFLVLFSAHALSLHARSLEFFYFLFFFYCYIIILLNCHSWIVSGLTFHGGIWARRINFGAIFHSFPCVKNRLFEWNFMSQLVRDAAAGLHLHSINKETHIWSWVGVFVAEYWALEFLQVFFYSYCSSGQTD